nr:AMP-binding protein [Ornithinimicrobium cavernae]
MDRDPGAPFVVSDEGTHTFGDIHAAAVGLSTYMLQRGLGHGDRVGLYLRNSREFVVTIFACARIGAVLVPFNTELKGDLLRRQVEDATVSLMVTGGPLAAEMATHHHALGLGMVLTTDDELSAHHTLSTVSFHHAERSEQPSDVSPVEIKETDLQAIMYTSGTTGPSKGVMVPHSQTLAYAHEWMRCVGLSADDVIYCPLPLFHTIGHSLGIVPAAVMGIPIVVRDRFSASAYWDDVRRFKATVCLGIHSILQILLAREPSENDKDHTGRAFYNGNQDRSPEFEKRFGVEVFEAYGATENGMVAFTLGRERRPGSCGFVNDSLFDVLIADENDNEVPYGEVGEILIRPKLPNVMSRGYWNRDDATAAAWRNLWYHSGDFGKMDPEGALYFMDRKGDAIRRRGENISSYEVESVLNKHESIEECAVVAVPSPVGEDDVMAVVVSSTEARPSPLDLWRFLEEQLPSFMVPRYIDFVAKLPKTANEKVDKNLVRSFGPQGPSGRANDRETM